MQVLLMQGAIPIFACSSAIAQDNKGTRHTRAPTFVIMIFPFPDFLFIFLHVKNAVTC